MYTITQKQYLDCEKCVISFNILQLNQTMYKKIIINIVIDLLINKLHETVFILLINYVIIAKRYLIPN